jgi:lipopolysaccharide biosynthesis protein
MIPHLSLAEPGRSWRHFKKARRSRRNPSELAWDRLVAAGVPFVKVGLFRVNHYGLNLRHVLRGLEATTPYDVGLIRRHLARVGSQPLD